jgi:hypothetical protein
MKKKDKSRNFDIDPVDRKRKLSERNEKSRKQNSKKKSNNWQDWLDEDEYI